MKKYIIVFAFLGLIFVGSPAKAQTAPLTSEQVAVFQTTINQLLEIVRQLMIQLAEVKAQQDTIQAQITNQMTEKSFSSTQRIAYVAPVEIDKSKLTIVRSEGNVSPDFPHGQVIFTVTYFDKDGSPTKEVKDITMEVPDNLNEPNIETRPTNPVGQIVFGYIPKNAGMKTVSFSSGSLNESMTFEVK